MANVRSLLLVSLLFLASLPLSGAQLVPIASFPPGESPSASLFQDANSNFYGVTANGGVFGNGTIYMVTPTGAFSTLYSFDGTHGAAPEAPLVKGPNGEFFGTASQGGIGNGVIFQFSPVSPFSVVAMFNSSTNIPGSMPTAGLFLGNDGVLYGTTVAGGSNDDGTIFRLSLGRNGFSNLFSFSETNGASPYAGLIQGGNGLLYGTTRYGGNGAGTVFEIDTNGNFTNLASFAGVDGAGPNQIVQGRDGNFYGTTLEGGTSGAGTIFRMTSEGTIESLFSFNGVSGSQPVGKLVPGLNGLLYGVTLSGGSNGLGTIFTVNTNGAFTNVAAFADFGFPPAGLIQGDDGNLYGTATSGGANGSGVIYELSGFPPTILVQPVARLNEADGASVTFSVSATPQPVAYQWMRNGMPLGDSNEISGSTTSKVTIDPATWVDVGSYSVIITNGGGSITSAVVALGITQPTVAITSPHASARTTNTLITGTASGKPGKTPLTNVLWTIDNLATGTEILGSATLVSNGLTDTWSIPAGLLPGTNIVVVQSVDRSNIVSSRVSEEFFYIQAAPFVLSTDGPGTVKGAASIAGNVRPTNGAMLNIGEGYTLTAVAAKNYVLTNWTVATNGTVFLTTNSATLHFVMKEGMEIAANFTTNLFIGAAETYNGLFYDATNGVSEGTAGMLNSLTLNSQGSYTAKLLFDGGSYNFSGSFDTSGNAVKTIAAKGGSVTITMALDWTSGQINGTVSGAGWSSALYAEAASKTAGSGDYTLLLEPESTNAIVGDGYLLLTNHLSDAVFSGALGDGSSISVSSKIGRLGDVPLFQNLYGNAGLVLGWLTFSNGTLEASPLTWVKASETGFTNSLSVVASGWTNPPANLLTDGVLVISGDGLDLTNIVSIEGDKIIQQPGSVTNSLAGTINPRTGLMTITFGNGAGKATTTAHGVFLEGSGSAGGYFLIKTNAGGFSLGR